MKSFNFIINQFIRCVSGASLNLFRYAAMVIMLLTLGIGNAWAGGSTYKTDFKATAEGTGKGYVYASTSSSPSSKAYAATSDDISESEDTGGSDKTTTYYAWAEAVRGYEFKNWSISGSNGGVSPTSSTNNPVTVTVTSNKEKGTNTGTATANWTSYTKVNVTYNPSEDGVYSVTYQYNSYDATTQEITTGDAENLSRTISSENGAQTIDSYKNDVITLKSTSGTFLGWYSDAGFTSQLSTDNPYTYTAPTSGSAAVYPKYEHVDKYYGRLTTSIAAVPYSMPGGGTIFVSKEEAGTGTYSADAQTVDNIGMGTTGLKYYLHAQPTDKRYVFRGWYSNPECTGTALSTNADYTYTFTSSSTNSASPTTGNVYAAFDFNLYYIQVEVEPAVPGLGMVLVKDNNKGTPEYTDYTTHAEQFLYAYRLTPTANAYLYAKPKYGYKFSGWYDNPDCTGMAKSTANPYAYAATGTSTDPMNPTIIPLYAKFVVDDAKVNITYNIPDKTKGEYTASVLDIAEVDDDFVWTFTEVYNSADYTANTTLSQNKTDVLRLEAQPKAGYGVTSWTIAGAAKTTPSQLYETTGTAAATYGVTFGDAKPFLVCATTAATTGTAYATLAEALANLGTNKKIVVVQNAYVPAGDYIIPSGVTLLVPFDEAQTLYTAKPGITTAAPSGQSVYCTLTLGNGANVKVNGAISVSAHQNKGQPYGGAVTGKYGKIELKEGANITLNSGSYLYCWGYITGAGSVDALNGSTVYEDFQITCWRGGSCASDMVGNAQKVFPLAQYAIQNIEARINFHYGSSETVYTGVTVKYFDPETSAKIIGTTDGLFQLSSGAVLSRWFNASTDRQMYELEGNASIGYVLINMYANIDSRSYVLPITNNMDITVKSGTMSCDNDFALLPGASITIDKGAKASLGSNCRLYVYDKSEWPEKTTGYNYPSNVAFCKVAYTDTKITTARTYANMADAKLDVNGTLEISKAIYTTAGGANICSSEGTGLIVLKAAAGTENITYQAIQESNYVKEYVAIPITAAKLHNGDDSYTLTAGAVANDQFIYSKTQERWLKNPKVVSWNANGGTTEASTLAYSEGSFVGELPAAYKDGHTLEGWYTAADGGKKIDATTKVTANITYYAHWTPKSYTITYRDLQGVAFTGAHVDTPNAHPTTHTFGTATALTGATKEHYTFGGWYRTPSCSGAVVTSIAASECKNITLYAKWSPKEYTITYKDKGNVAFSGVHGDGYPTKHTYGTATTLVNPTKENYIFDGWYTSSDCSTGQVTSLGATDYSAGITLYAKWTAAVAKIGTDYYATLPAAITAANGKSNATVTMLQSVTITSEISLTAAMTIDLNGKTIISTQAAAVGVFKINASGKTVTIKDSGTGGKIDHTANYSTSSSYMYGINLTAGTLNIESGTIYAKNTASNRAYGIYANGSTAIITMSNGTVEAESSNSPFGLYANAINSLTMTGGTFIANGPTSRGIYTKGTTTLTNATITSSGENSHAIFAKSGNLTINSGTYTATGTGTGYAIYFEAGTVTVNGGKFNGISADIGKRNTDYSVALKGGYYVHRTDLDAKCAEHYRVKTLSETHPEYANGYRFTVDNAYTITWQLDGVTIREDEVAYGDTPDYGETPTKPSDEQYDYSFSGWTPNIVQATSDKTYSGSFNANTHYYTIIWKNYNGDILETDEGVKGGMQYGATPQYDGATPTKTGDANRSYNFKGWSPTPASVAGDQVYTAQYNMDIDVVDTPEPMVISEDEEAVVTTVQVSGALRVPEGNTLTTNDLIVEASSNGSGAIDGIERVTVTGDAYFDYKFDVDPWHWSAFGVPFEIDLDAAAPLKEKTEALGILSPDDYDIVYYDTEERAINGASKNCWKYVDNETTHRLIPGRLYMIAFDKHVGHVGTVRFKKAIGALVNSTTPVDLITTGPAGGDNNWNGIANPMMYHALLGAGVTECQVHDGGEIGKDGYYTYDMNNKKFYVGKAAFVQVPNNQSPVVVTPATDQSPIVQQAPRRAQASMATESRYDIRIAPADGAAADRLLILAEEDKADEYVIVSDLAKAGVSPVRVQMWVDRYGEKLCKNTTAYVNNKADYPLVISAPVAGEYEIFINEMPDDETMLYLTYNGKAIWNLSYSAFVADMEKGTTNNYGLRIVRTRKAGTDIEETTIQNGDAVRKVIVDNKVYIIRNGEIYSITGQKAK